MKLNMLRIRISVIALIAFASCQKNTFDLVDNQTATRQLSEEEDPGASPVNFGDLYSVESNYLWFNDMDELDKFLRDTTDYSDSIFFELLRDDNSITTYAEDVFIDGYLDGLDQDSEEYFEAMFKPLEAIYWMLNADQIVKIQNYLIKFDLDSREILMMEYVDGSSYSDLISATDEDDFVVALTMDDEVIDVIDYLNANNGVWDIEDYDSFWGCSESKAASATGPVTEVNTYSLYGYTGLEIYMRVMAKYEKFGVYCTLKAETYGFVINSNGTFVGCSNYYHVVNYDRFHEPICENIVGPYNNYTGTHQANGQGKNVLKYYRATKRLHEYNLKIRTTNLGSSYFTPYSTVSYF